jgi:hypothetical protein
MAAARPLPETHFERHRESLLSPAVGFLTIGVTILMPGLLLLFLGQSWLFALGIALVAISCPVSTVGLAGFGSTLVARWAERHRSYA